MNKSRKTPEQLMTTSIGASQFLQRNQLQLIHPTQGIGYRTNTHHPHYLSQGFTVSLDVVGSPKDTGNGFRPFAIVFSPLTISRADPPQFWLKVQQLLWELIGVEAWIFLPVGRTSGLRIGRRQDQG